MYKIQGITPHKAILDELQPDPHKRTVALSKCQIAAASDALKHDLEQISSTGMDGNYRYVTCDKCNINAVCLYSFDIYNTDGDCLLK